MTITSAVYLTVPHGATSFCNKNQGSKNSVVLEKKKLKAQNQNESCYQSALPLLDSEQAAVGFKHRKYADLLIRDYWK